MVYVVGAGEYSDYSVLAVFTDLERAKSYARRQRAQDESRWADTVYIDAAPLDPGADKGLEHVWSTDDDEPDRPYVTTFVASCAAQPFNMAGEGKA